MELRRLSSQQPLLLIPTHRSYLDFILVTWLLYSYDIKTPVIAAGQVREHVLLDCGNMFLLCLKNRSTYWSFHLVIK